MKNFGSILTLLAISASVVSARALPSSEDGVEARAPFAIGEYLTHFSKYITKTKQCQSYSLVHQRKIRLLVRST
jgi:hypothetical protein